MGSFAETFLLHSTVPTLVINPHCAASGDSNHILFATDFSAQSLAAFDQTVAIAAQLKARISVVHYSHTPKYASLLGEALFGEVADEIERRVKKEKSLGAALVTKGLGQKVKTSFHLITGRGTFDPSSAIAKFAKLQGVGFISLAARSGVLKSALMGATSRELARNATCPVLIYRS
jgi:nucleotide-binding universal stress UspA family protein